MHDPMPSDAPPIDPDGPRALLVRPSPRPLSGALRVPGDKSISHRALMFGALALGRTEIDGLLDGEDVRATARAMVALGAEVWRTASGTWNVVGRGVGGLAEPADVLDMGNSGTAARLLCGLLATHPIVSVMTGDASLRRRPMRRVTGPLEATGARFVSREGGLLPMAIEGTGEALAVEHRLEVASAQVKSALLLAGLNARGRSVVDEPVATRDHTENMLRHFGATLAAEPLAGGGTRLVLDGQPELVARPVAVPGDPSSAAFPLVAGLLVPGSVVSVEAVGMNPLRTGLFETLAEMGAVIEVTNRRIEAGEPVADIAVRAGPLRAVDVPAERAPRMIDEYPILAVACAAAAGTSRLRGLAELRVKESDRLDATARLLEAGGVRVSIEGDDLVIEGQGGPPPGGGRVHTRMDHRLAMSGVVLGLSGRSPVAIDDMGFVDTSFPGFVALMDRLGAGLGGA